jgi:hypothetical protein
MCREAPIFQPTRRNLGGVDRALTIDLLKKYAGADEMDAPDWLLR